MCNRYRASASEIEIAKRFGIPYPGPERGRLPPPELFPKRDAWVARKEPGQRVLDVMRWGFPRPVPAVFL